MKLKNIINLNLAAVAAAGLFSFASCSDDYNGFELWEGYEVKVPSLKPRYIWVDAASNFQDFANSKENIARDLTLAKEAGFTDIVVDVRSTTGDILYKSDLCEQATCFNAWPIGGGKKQTYYRTETWDYLQAFIDEGHKLGLRIHAGFNTMTGGHASGGAEESPAGILFRDSSKKEWANWRYNGGDPKNVMDLGDTEKFFNPGNPEVQEYLCGLLADLAKYDIDGIVLDRGRYNDLYSDFSPLSRQQFEEYIGVKLSKFPGDILPPGTTNATFPAGAKYGQYTTKWLEFRAKTIHDFMLKARDAVKSVNPNIMFGVYVGGWYRSYYNTGVNWASKTFDASKGNQWASPRFKQFGYADLMDQILIGAYAKPNGVYGTDEWTMEGFCLQAMQKIKGDCPLVVGGPDVDWRWNPEADWSEKPDDTTLTTEGYPYTKAEIMEAIKNSVTACANACDGYFLFDMVHLKIDPEKWEAIKAGNIGYVSDWNDKYGEKEESPETPATPAE